ncbi:MAG: 3-dehydroquinate synthase [Gemmatimonadaceae bacterium]|nr:3-dehydroquinate synthase [Gemmatimonadaceae bacterium]
MRTVIVRLPAAAYPIAIDPGLLLKSGAYLRTLTRASSVFVITDSNVGARFLAALSESLRKAGFRVAAHTVPAGENFKTLDQVGHIYDKLIGGTIDRQSIVIALGGGVIGDMTGFAAATVLRGVAFVQIPTSLLSMVDASVGGKTGINHPLGKNLIGAFHQPIAVLIDPQTLQTLPEHELRGGLAECIKHDIIRDAEHFSLLETSIDRALALDMTYLADLVAHNVAIKARVVEADPFERGERAHLNFGHTFGHAIENVSRFSLTHGQSVALGMVAASRTARRLGMLDELSERRIIALIFAAGLPTGGLTLDTDAVMQTMFLDKKVQSGKIRFVLPDRIGHVVIRDDLPSELVREALVSLKG